MLGAPLCPVVIVNEDTLDDILPLAAAGVQFSATLVAYADLLATPPFSMQPRARFIRRHLVANQWSVARVILPSQALKSWHEDRAQNGSEEHQSMAEDIVGTREYVKRRDSIAFIHD